MKDSKSEKIEKKEKKLHDYKSAVIGLTIATSILGATTLGLGIAYGVAQSQVSDYSMQLENVYKRNYYELVDTINTADMNMSKLLVSNNNTYKAKMLTSLSQSAKQMQDSMASLPLNGEGVSDSVRFVNQMSGYTQVLEEKMAKGGTLSEADLNTLSQMHDSLTEMKRYFNQMSQRMFDEGYSIIRASSNMEGDTDEFSIEFVQMKSSGTEYPTMIYDGPFSDSIVNQKIKGLNGVAVSKDEAYQKIDKLFKNVSNIKYEGESTGKFETYNYNMEDSDGQAVYVQITKLGGHVLTVSGNVESEEKNISFDKAKKIALDFAKENGVKDAEVVWSEELDSQCYFNIAPKQNGVILYPDLVKVKVDMQYGTVIGYEAMSYWTNHTSRQLGKAQITSDEAKQNISKSFNIKNERLVLAPLDYNREALCYEFECERDGATYYIYINAQTNVEENILKVVKTTDGSKLM